MCNNFNVRFFQFEQHTDESAFTGRLRDPTVGYSESAREQAKPIADFEVAIEMNTVTVTQAVVAPKHQQSVSDN